MPELPFQQIALAVAQQFFGDDVPAADLEHLVYEAVNFDCPIAPVRNGVYALELFHGPTLAFKDVGGRFMARLLAYFLGHSDRTVNVLVATSGDTGSAVANGFLGVPGIHVYVLYPKGLVSDIQEKQFTTLGRNITAVEVDGVFDDCQRLVKAAFLDGELREAMTLTSANSINVARFLPQTFYYFNAYARVRERGDENALVISVPSGNFGNLTAGLFAAKMGLPISRFIAANNANDVVYKYLQTGIYEPCSSIATIANAMDVGAPSNFARILELYDHSYKAVSAIIHGARYSDAQIRETVRQLYEQTGYIADPHGATAYAALTDYLNAHKATGVFLETAHPAKFLETMDGIVGKGAVTVPEKLRAFMNGEKRTVPMSRDFADFKTYLLNKV